MNSRLVLTVSVFMRLAAGLLLLIGLARFLRPADLGAISLALAAGGLISVAQDFGQPTFMLRRIGIWPASAARITYRALLIKLLLFLTSIIPVILGTLWLAGALYSLTAVIIILAGCIAGFAEIFSGTLRALRLYGREFVVSCAASIPYVILPVTVASQTDNLLLLAGAILAARVVQLAVAIGAGASVLRYNQWRAGWGRKIGTTLRASRGFASESMLINGSNQIDTFLLGTLLPLADFGTYQAGSRFTQAAAPLASILMTSNLPRTSSAIHHNVGHRSATIRVFTEFLLAGLVMSGLLYVLGPLISQHLYLDRFPGLNQLWGGLAGATLLRFSAAPFNLLLTAHNRPNLPAIARAAYSISLALALVWIAPRFGLAGIPLALVLSGSVLVLVSSAQYFVFTKDWKTTLVGVVPSLFLSNLLIGPQLLQ